MNYGSFGSDQAQHELSPAQHSTDGHGTMNPRPERRAETLAGRAWSLGTRVNRVHTLGVWEILIDSHDKQITDSGRDVRLQCSYNNI
jgi:hypothetical protein